MPQQRYLRCMRIYTFICYSFISSLKGRMSPARHSHRHSTSAGHRLGNINLHEEARPCARQRINRHAAHAIELCSTGTLDG